MPERRRGAEYNRQSVRLKGRDYARQGAYFITVVTLNREQFFGAIDSTGSMALSPVGRIAVDCWNAISDHHRNAQQDAFVVMPNHIYGIVLIQGNTILGESAESRGSCRGVQLNAPTAVNPINRDAWVSRLSPRSGTLSVIVRTYKAAVTTFARSANLDFAWQRNYCEHIICSDAEMDAIRTYIARNPVEWASDSENKVS